MRVRFPPSAPTARCSGSDTICKIVERGSTPRRASECFRPRPGPASSKRRDARSTRAGSATSHSSSGRGRWILNPTTVGSIPPCDATSPPTVGSRSTKPAREGSTPSGDTSAGQTLRRRTIAALRRLRTGFDSRRRGRWDGATVAHEFHTLGISRFNSDPSNADDPRRDARFISAATRGSSPLVSTNSRPSRVSGRTLNPTMMVRLHRRDPFRRPTVGSEFLRLATMVRLRPPDPTETRLRAGHVFREHTLAGSIPASPTTGGEAAGEAGGLTNRRGRVRFPGLLPIRRRPVAVARPYKRASSVRLRGGGPRS